MANISNDPSQNSQTAKGQDAQLWRPPPWVNGGNETTDCNGNITLTAPPGATVSVTQATLPCANGQDKQQGYKVTINGKDWFFTKDQMAKLTLQSQGEALGRNGTSRPTSINIDKSVSGAGFKVKGADGDRIDNRASGMDIYAGADSYVNNVSDCSNIHLGYNCTLSSAGMGDTIEGTGHDHLYVAGDYNHINLAGANYLDFLWGNHNSVVGRGLDRIGQVVGDDNHIFEPRFWGPWDPWNKPDRPFRLQPMGWEQQTMDTSSSATLG